MIRPILLGTAIVLGALFNLVFIAALCMTIFPFVCVLCWLRDWKAGAYRRIE